MSDFKEKLSVGYLRTAGRSDELRDVLRDLDEYFNALGELAGKTEDKDVKGKLELAAVTGKEKLKRLKLLID